MELNVKPVPIPDPVSAFYWENAKNGRLTVQGFEGLDIRQHPPGPTPEIPGGGPRGPSRSRSRSAVAARCIRSRCFASRSTRDSWTRSRC